MPVYIIEFVWNKVIFREFCNHVHAMNTKKTFQLNVVCWILFLLLRSIASDTNVYSFVLFVTKTNTGIFQIDENISGVPHSNGSFFGK